MVQIWPRSVFVRSHDKAGPKIRDSIAQHEASGPSCVTAIPYLGTSTTQRNYDNPVRPVSKDVQEGDWAFVFG